MFFVQVCSLYLYTVAIVSDKFVLSLFVQILMNAVQTMVVALKRAQTLQGATIAAVKKGIYWTVMD